MDLKKENQRNSFSQTKFRNIFIDGQAACFKTSILGYAGRKYKTTLELRNSHPLSLMGYLFSAEKFAIEHQNEHVFIDRTPANCFDWSVFIWSALVHFGTKISANLSDIRSFYESKTVDIETLVSLHERYVTVFVGDSNFDSCRERMRKRNEGSDLERSFWANYPEAQFVFYQFLAEKTNSPFFDKNKFHSNSEFMKTVKSRLEELFQTNQKIIPEQNLPNCEFDFGPQFNEGLSWSVILANGLFKRPELVNHLLQDDGERNSKTTTILQTNSKRKISLSDSEDQTHKKTRT